MIVLDRNLFEVAADEIGDTEVDLTVFDGEIVYDPSVPPAAFNSDGGLVGEV